MRIVVLLLSLFVASIGAVAALCIYESAPGFKTVYVDQIRNHLQDDS